MQKNIAAEITRRLENRKNRSKWAQGVNEYAFELIEVYEEMAKQKHREAEDTHEMRVWMLNGADSWAQYSYGGCSLICDGDIAERLATPSALKKSNYGEKNPNAHETWLDVQARALRCACNRICGEAANIERENRIAKKGAI